MRIASVMAWNSSGKLPSCRQKPSIRRALLVTFGIRSCGGLVHRSAGKVMRPRMRGGGIG
jgi:hypothetical protein